MAAENGQLACGCGFGRLMHIHFFPSTEHKEHGGTGTDGGHSGGDTEV